VRVVTLVLALALGCAIGGAAAAPAGASGPPTAGMSINPGSGPLSVTFVAKWSGFAKAPDLFVWRFGDGQMMTTASPSTVHIYGQPGQYPLTGAGPLNVTISDSVGDTATSAPSTLQVFVCPTATQTCDASLVPTAGPVMRVELKGNTKAGVVPSAHLLADPWSFGSCEPALETSVGVTDSGFISTPTSPLTLTLKYTSASPANAALTCFSSPKPFTSSTGTTVRTGILPTCAATARKPPCVQSVGVNGSVVTKVLLLPAGDPKTGAP
jgi:hypothetical protein